MSENANADMPSILTEVPVLSELIFSEIKIFQNAITMGEMK